MEIWNNLKLFLDRFFYFKKTETDIKISNEKIDVGVVDQPHSSFDQVQNLSKEKCNNCKGMGRIRIHHHPTILPPGFSRLDRGYHQDNDIYKTCPWCKGKGYI